MKKEFQARFLSTAVHQLRTPLAAIKEGINLVADESLGPLTPKQKQFLGLARRNVERLSRLMTDVFDFQKIQNSGGLINFKKQNLNALILGAHKIMQALALEKGLVFQLDLGQGIPEISMDPALVERVLVNLMTNAIINTNRGTITVVSSLREKEVHIQVKDTGVGIQPQDMGRLFEAFEQFGDAARSLGASGLGLLMCKEIVEQHGGKIWAQSQWQKGSNFQFTLPVDGE